MHQDENGMRQAVFVAAIFGREKQKLALSSSWERGAVHLAGVLLVIVCFIVGIAVLSSLGSSGSSGSSSSGGGDEKEGRIAELTRANTALSAEVERLEDRLRKQDALCDMLRQHDAQARKDHTPPKSSDEKLDELRRRTQPIEAPKPSAEMPASPGGELPGPMTTPGLPPGAR